MAIQEQVNQNTSEIEKINGALVGTLEKPGGLCVQVSQLSDKVDDYEKVACDRHKVIMERLPESQSFGALTRRVAAIGVPGLATGGGIFWLMLEFIKSQG